MRDSNQCWQKKLELGFSTAAELLDFLELPFSLANGLAEKQFKTRVPRGFAERMKSRDPNDPLLLQVLAQNAELISAEGYVKDPLAEENAVALPGLMQKYHGRVLLTLTGACAINCRYCFRRHFPYSENNPGRAGWQKQIDYIANDPLIHEVILSGGDPLLVKDNIFADLLDKLSQITHLRTLRIHTRIPVVLPERITTSFLKIITENRLRKVVVLHCNHPQEIDESVRKACSELQKSGCHLLNQSVLLAGVNNDANILAELSESLFAAKVLPYYLHLLDKVDGAHHFDVPINEAKLIFKKLQAILPGYLVPRLAKEEAHGTNKVIIGSVDN